MTVGGPVRLPGYNGARRTTFTASYNGNRGDQLFDQYATVPTAAMRAGDFSAVPLQLVDPRNGQPLENNQIPASNLSESSQALLRFIPLPNLDGDNRNFRYSTTTDSLTDNVNLRVTHNFTQAAAGRGGPGGRGGGAAGGRTRRRARWTRQPGHIGGDECAAAIPPQRQRTEQRLPDPRRHQHRLERERARVVQHRAAAHDAQRQPELHPVHVAGAGALCVCRRRRRQRRHYRRLYRSTQLGRAVTDVLEHDQRS